MPQSLHRNTTLPDGLYLNSNGHFVNAGVKEVISFRNIIVVFSYTYTNM